MSEIMVTVFQSTDEVLVDVMVVVLVFDERVL